MVPTAINYSLFRCGDVKSLIGNSLIDLFSSADFRIFNLETPLCDAETPIQKCGINLSAPTDTATGIKAMGVDLLTLANNHILDQGEQGLASTCEVLSEQGISYVGVGKTPKAAAEPFILETDTVKIGIYACCEHEFSVVTEHSAGANPFDPLESLDHIAALKQTCDRVIVLYHGGKEHYRYPSPMLQKRCRKMVDKGADLIICQHSHCIGCYEKYLNGTIVYGQGNFLFHELDHELRQTGLLVEIEDDFSVSYIPIIKKEAGISLADENTAQSILREFEARSEEIKAPQFVQQKFQELSNVAKRHYLLSLGGKESFVFRVINKLSGDLLRHLRIKRYDEKARLCLQNYLTCETHTELLLRGITDKE